jgi:hypothetical protein
MKDRARNRPQSFSTYHNSGISSFAASFSSNREIAEETL